MYRSREDEFCRDVFAESAVDLAHLFTFCVCILLLAGEGIGGRGHRAHGEVINAESRRRGKWAKLGLPDTVVIRGYHNRVEVKNKGRRAVSVLGPARHRYRVGGG